MILDLSLLGGSKSKIIKDWAADLTYCARYPNPLQQGEPGVLRLVRQ
jgi:hypothetical protein